MSLIIRNADSRDIEKIVLFQVEMARETEGLVLNKNIIHPGVKNVFKNKNLGSYYVAEHDQKVVGSLLITYEWSDWRNGIVWWIQSVFIQPEFRGQKIFKKMFTFLREMVLNSNDVRGLRLYVDKTNSHAIKVYKAIGMNAHQYDLFEWFPE